MTVPAAICVASVCLCLYVALLAVRLSQASGWRDQKLLALASISAAFFIVGDLPMMAATPDPYLMMLAARWQLLGAVGSGGAWLFFSRNILGLRRTLLEPGFTALSGMLAVVCIIPGVGFTGRQYPPIVVPWAGAVYHIVEPTDLGTLTYAVFCLGYLGLTVRFARAVYRGRRDLFWYLLGMTVTAVSTLNDALVVGGVYVNIYLTDIGQMVPLAAAAMTQTRELVQISLALDRTIDRLKRALEDANEAVRLKSEFLAVISHELRTPLNAVINIPGGIKQHFRDAEVDRCAGCLSRFEREPGDGDAPSLRCPECGAETVRERMTVLEMEPADVRRHLGMVERSGKHLLSVVDDILNYSKLEAGKMTLRFEDVRASTLLDDVRQLTLPLATERDVALQFDYGGVDFVFRADPVRWIQVMVNLITNAVKFSHPGGRVEICARADEGGYRFSVRDFGVGIAPEHHELIFEAFRQVDGSHTRAVGGTGLGLALTRELVRLHGGAVELQSAPGEGSTFSAWLPARPLASGALNEAAS